MSNWIDFKKLRDSLEFDAVLEHYGVKVKLKGDQHHGFCPLPNHNGQRNSPSFSASMSKKAFRCFGCGAQGGILQFAAYMEGLNPNEGRDLRKVGITLNRIFCPETKVSRAKNPKTDITRSRPIEPKPKPVQMEIGNSPSVLINAPLDFELKDLDEEHPYLLGRGFTPETIRHFGLGYCSRGYFKGRAVVPLHSSESRLIGYAGRITDDVIVGEDCPKYLFPGTRERAGKIFEFRKGEILYNAHRLKGPIDDLIVVEGFASVWWLHQHGFEHSVALMGWACSEQQAKIVCSLVKPHGCVWILPDGDEAGDRCAVNVFKLTALSRSVRLAQLARGKQPTDCAKYELQMLFKK